MTIEDEANALLALSEEMKQKVGEIHALVDGFNQHVWNTTLSIIGNMHDPLITTIQSHTRYANELLEDYVKNMTQAAGTIKRKGYALRQVGF